MIRTSQSNVAGLVVARAWHQLRPGGVTVVTGQSRWACVSLSRRCVSTIQPATLTTIIFLPAPLVTCV